MSKTELSFLPQNSSLEEFKEEISLALEKLIGQKEWHNELLLALEEALTNVLEHGFKKVQNPPPIILSLKLEKNKLVIKIKDKGIPYDITKQNPINQQEEYKNYKKRGLGIFLIQNIASRLNYLMSPQEGNVLTIEKDL